MTLALELAYWQQTTIKALVILIMVPTATAIIVQTFLFKVMAHMQSRLGPMEAGPHGALQLMADGGKFLQKEVIAPERADRRVFALAPVVVLVSTFLVWVIIPAGPNAIVADFDVGIFFALAVSPLSTIGVLMAGWASANKYALIGGLRAAGQLIAYELPLVLAAVGVVIQAETMSMQGIIASQHEGEIFGFGAFGNPYAITQVVGMLVFLMAVQAELTQTPFDMPVAESELVAGYQVEYSGLPFLFFYIGEFGTAFAFSAIAATLFLGGWTVPLVDMDNGWMHLIGPVSLFVKTMLVAFVIFWVRFTYPRFREDQLQTFAWKFLIPISLLNILATAVLKVAF
ncbi:NADH-quinone oxidoreductase subunit H [soil metagenome]